MEHYENPRNVGAMNKNDADVGTVRMRIGTVGVILLLSRQLRLLKNFFYTCPSILYS